MNELWKKWRHYRSKYGAIHAGVAFIGRKQMGIWHLCGPIVTHRYRRGWLSKHMGARILNLGGGSHVRPEWLTADVDPRADAYVDITRPLPFEDGSWDAIFLEEVIEHVSYEQGRALLIECCRILRSGGTIRLSTPDLDWFVNQKKCNLPVPSGIMTDEARSILGSEAGEDSALPVAAFNSIFLSHGHCFIYDQASLAQQMVRSGFDQIRFGHYQEQTPLGRFDSHADRFQHPPEMSLYAEACKP